MMQDSSSKDGQTFSCVSSPMSPPPPLVAHRCDILVLQVLLASPVDPRANPALPARIRSAFSLSGKLLLATPP